MPIKRKDGTTYKLTGPNPIMVTQDRWDRSKLVFHNFCWKGKTVPDTSAITPYSSAFRLNPVGEKPMMVQPVAVPEPEVKVTYEEPEPIVQQAEPEVFKNKIQVWCLPAKIKDVKDSLYGDSYRTIKYGEKFIFEGIVVENNDLTFSIWTNVPHVAPGAVIFPRNEDKRHWRVSTVTPKTGGYLLNCIMSDFQPDFGERA